MNVFRATCGTCIYNRQPICELCHDLLNNAMYSEKCAYTPVHKDNEGIVQITPKDRDIITAMLNNEGTTDVIKEIAMKCLCVNTNIYWNIINGKLYLTAKINQTPEV